MPAVLQLEPRPALKALTEIFGDIVLYFFSFEQTQRSSKDLNIILRFMNREKLKLRSDISGVELFTSNQLWVHAKLIWGKNQQLYSKNITYQHYSFSVHKFQYDIEGLSWLLDENKYNANISIEGIESMTWL